MTVLFDQNLCSLSAVEILLHSDTAWIFRARSPKLIAACAKRYRGEPESHLCLNWPSANGSGDENSAGPVDIATAAQHRHA